MNKKRGFTLIELLTTVMIIAILTAIAVPQYRRSILRAEATEALVGLRAIFESASRYKAEHSRVPINIKELDVGFFDAVEVSSQDHQSTIGNFLYTFSDDGISACQLNPDSNTATGTYCFTVYYNHPDYGRGAFTCETSEESSQKYASICPGFGVLAEGSSTVYLLD